MLARNGLAKAGLCAREILDKPLFIGLNRYAVAEPKLAALAILG